MSEILDKAICLSLNRNWERIGWKTIRQAIVSLCPNAKQDPQVVALDIELDADGRLIQATPTNWDDWINLTIRTYDLSITTRLEPFKAIRAPMVVVAKDFSQMPLKEPQLTSNAILERDGYTCQYSGKRLSRSQLNIDHVVPRDRGGKDSFENMVACDKQINFDKSNKLNEEAGLKLIRSPKRPKAVPASFLVRDPKHAHHVPFFTNR